MVDLPGDDVACFDKKIAVELWRIKECSDFWLSYLSKEKKLSYLRFS